MRRPVLILMILSVLIVAGCARRTISQPDAPLYSKTPEAAVQRAFDLCRAGKYDEAVRLYMNGPGLLKTHPESAKRMVDRACFTYKGTATRYVITGSDVRGDGASLDVEIFFHPPDHPDSKFEFNPWQLNLLKQPRGWLIAT